LPQAAENSFWSEILTTMSNSLGDVDQTVPSNAFNSSIVNLSESCLLLSKQADEVATDTGEQMNEANDVQSDSKKNSNMFVRPVRACAKLVAERIAAITAWENLSEKSETFKRMAAALDAEFAAEKRQRVKTSQVDENDSESMPSSPVDSVNEASVDDDYELPNGMCTDDEEEDDEESEGAEESDVPTVNEDEISDIADTDDESDNENSDGDDNDKNDKSSDESSNSDDDNGISDNNDSMHKRKREENIDDSQINE
jgi:hypothetical protein